MDLSKLDTVKGSEAGAVLVLRHPTTNKPLKNGDDPISITLLGKDSTKYQNAHHAAAAKRLENLSVKGSKISIDSEGLSPVEDAARILSQVTLGWSGIVVEGQPVPFSEAAAFDLYVKFPWIREQVDTFIVDRANFLGN